jgi:hypothetical protein
MVAQGEQANDEEGAKYRDNGSDHCLLVRGNQLLSYVKQIVRRICGLLGPQFWKQLRHHLTGSTTLYPLGLVEQEVYVGIFASDIEVLDPGADVLLHLS